MSHLLIIDDDANTLASLSRAFRMEGYEVTVADHAARALELVRTQTFDLILSDVVMPDKDGVSLLEEMRAAGVNGCPSDEAWRPRFPGKASLYGTVAAHGRECLAVEAAGAGEPRVAGAGRPARNRLAERCDAPCHGAGGARGGR